LTKELLRRKFPVTLVSMLYFILCLLSSKILLIFLISILTAINILTLILMRREPAKIKTVFAVSLHFLFFLFILGFFEMLTYSILIFLTANILIYRLPVLTEARRYYLSALFIAIFSILSVEGFLRITQNIEASKLYHSPDYPSLNIFKESASYSAENVFGDLIHPNANKIECQFRNQSFKTDEQGYLNSSECYAKSIDIMILGDSYSSLSAMNLSDLWVELLRKRVKLNICNLAVSGNEPYQEFVSFCVMKEKVRFSDNAVLIWQFFEGNDFNTFYGEIREDCNYKTDYITHLNESLENFRGTNNVNILINRLSGKDLIPQNKLVEIETKSGKMHCLKDYIKAVEMPLEEIEESNEAGNLNEIIKIISNESQRRGIQPLILFIPSKCSVCRIIVEDTSSSYKRSGFSILLENICRENRVAFIESGYAMFAESKNLYAKNGEFLWWLDDSHLNPAGNKIIADTLYSFLKQGI